MTMAYSTTAGNLWQGYAASRVPTDGGGNPVARRLDSGQGKYVAHNIIASKPI